MIRLRTLTLSLTTGLVALLPTLAHAEMRALLVAVSDYPTLSESYQLRGPRNDVQRLRDVLVQRGFASEQVQLMADGVKGASSPTRANIMKALDDLGQTARSGDTVVLYFAGHGSQQPADPRTPEGRQEADGMHEIFLPSDVGSWDGKAQSVKNAIVDYEMRAKVDRIQSRGAFVWAMFDACHSGTMVRSAAGEEVRYRHVLPSDLGVPQGAAEPRTSHTGSSTEPLVDAGPLGAPVDRGASPPAGGAAYFYAVQTTELAPELPLPQGDPKRQPYGLFSFMITRALEMGQPMTYRQLGQYVLSQYAGMSEARVTPLFSGTALDQIVLGQQTLPVRQWSVTADKLNVPMGALSGLNEGAVFALLPSALSKPEEAVGYLKARQVDFSKSELEPVALDGKKAPTPADFKPGIQARLIQNPERYSLRVSVDGRECGPKCDWQPVIDKLRAQGVPGTDVQWVTTSPDIQLKLSADGVTALSGSEQGRIDCISDRKCEGIHRGTLLTARPATGKQDIERATQQLSSGLHTIARSNNLLKLAARLSTATRRPDLRVSLQVQRGKDGKPLPVTPESVPALQTGDTLSLTLDNRGSKPVDVTVLYADAKFGIGPLFPQQGEVNRLEAGASKQVDDIKISSEDGVFGIERLLVIAVEAEPHTERADFSFLGQPSLTHVRTRGAPVPDDVQAFMDAAYADHRTRGQPALTPSSRTGMQAYTFNVQPPTSEGRR